LSGTIQDGDTAIVDLDDDNNIAIRTTTKPERLLEAIVS